MKKSTPVARMSRALKETIKVGRCLDKLPKADRLRAIDGFLFDLVGDIPNDNPEKHRLLHLANAIHCSIPELK